MSSSAGHRGHVPGATGAGADGVLEGGAAGAGAQDQRPVRRLRRGARATVPLTHGSLWILLWFIHCGVFSCCLIQSGRRGLALPASQPSYPARRPSFQGYQPSRWNLLLPSGDRCTRCAWCPSAAAGGAAAAEQSSQQFSFLYLSFFQTLAGVSGPGAGGVHRPASGGAAAEPDGAQQRGLQRGILRRHPPR